MKILVHGCGWYGAHLSSVLIRDGHDVEIRETGDRIFFGASGGNPARLHLGPHYPRSTETRHACQQLFHEFMERYGDLTRFVPVNLYAIAKHDSLLDFETYRKVLTGELEFITVHDPREYGLHEVEGALLVPERHIIINKALKYFQGELDGRVKFGADPNDIDERDFDMVLDCTFCSRDEVNVDRYEPCVTGRLEGRIDRAVTIMDGLFGSIYPWDEELGLCSLTSALLTPFSKKCKTWREARDLLDGLSSADVHARCEAMLDQMAKFWPAARDEFKIVGHWLSIRAMPKSAADTRTVDIVRSGERTVRIRAGKISSVFAAERAVKQIIRESRRQVKSMMVA